MQLQYPLRVQCHPRPRTADRRWIPDAPPKYVCMLIDLLLRGLIGWVMTGDGDVWMLMRSFYFWFRAPRSVEGDPRHPAPAPDHPLVGLPRPRGGRTGNPRLVVRKAGCGHNHRQHRHRYQSMTRSYPLAEVVRFFVSKNCIDLTITLLESWGK